ncbi:hypothetical protein [Agrobacterium pusense]|uniref:hypothetical protein n=1 Tax=Agrobacterium pusense TaxID=648995 RepID=UPI0028AE6DAF|nr:hypothetical protein [Agrobacterium pusense]
MAQQSDWSEDHWQRVMRVLGLPNVPRYRLSVEEIHGFIEAGNEERARREANNLTYLITSEEGYLRSLNVAFDTTMSRQDMIAFILERVDQIVQILDEDGDPANRADLDDIDGDARYDPANGGLDSSDLSSDNTDAMSDIPPDPNRVSAFAETEQFDRATMDRMERERAEMDGEGEQLDWPSVSEFRDFDEDSVEMDKWLGLDDDDASNPERTQVQEGVGALSLADFIRRLPGSVDALINDHMDRIVEAMRIEDDGGMARVCIDTLAFLLEQNAAPEDTARVNGTELRNYIRQIAANRKNREDEAEAQASHFPGPDGDDDGADGDGPGEPGLPEGVEALSPAEFIELLPDRADWRSGNTMAAIVDALRIDDNGLAEANIQSFAAILWGEATPANAARVNTHELRNHIRQTALEMLQEQDGDGPGDVPDGGNDGDDDHLRRLGRTSLDDIIEGNQSSQAGEQAQENVRDQNSDASSVPPGTIPVGNSPLLQLIRVARHLHGTQTVNTGMQNVRDALIERNRDAAQLAARQLASDLLRGRGDPQSPGLSAVVQKVADMILAEIDGALSEDEKKPVKSAQGNDGPDPRDGSRRGPDGGNPGAGAANGGTGHGGSAPDVQQRPASVYDRGTMDRMERERNQSTGTKEHLTALVSAGIRDITEMLVHKKNEEAAQRAVGLSKQLQGNGGLLPEMSPQTILKIAHGKAVALMATDPEPSPTQPVGGAGDLDDDDPGVTLDPGTAARLVPVTDWKAFCGVYKIEEKEIKNIKALALKAVREPKDALNGCKSIISRRKDKDQVKIKNEKYLAQALVHAVKMKAAKKKLTKPMKLSRAADL